MPHDADPPPVTGTADEDVRGPVARARTINGEVVQAGTIHGGVHIHPPQEQQRTAALPRGLDMISSVPPPPMRRSGHDSAGAEAATPLARTAAGP